MTGRREGLLADIEAGVLDDKVPLSSLLNKCIVLGGQAGSEKMRAWARQELNGYDDESETVPDYRHLFAPLIALLTNNVGYNGITQRVHPSDFPAEIRDWFREKKVELEDVILVQSIGVLEAWASEDTNMHKFSPPWSAMVMDTINMFNTAPNTRVAAVYWEVSNASIKGLLVRVRAALAELVTELVSLTPENQAVPDRGVADAAVHFVVTGDRNTINYSSQQATEGGTNTVTASGADGIAIGSQTAGGTNASVVGSQSAQGNHHVVAARDANNGAKEQPLKEGWWARLRKRGVLVAFFTVIGGIAGVVGALFAWAPWK